MANETERHTVETEYTVKDGSSGALHRIEAGFKAAGKEAEHLREKFKEFRGDMLRSGLAMVGLGFGLEAIYEKAKDAVMGFEKTKKSMQGLTAEIMAWPSKMGGLERFNASAGMATEITESLEENVRDYGGTLEEAAQGFKQLTASVAPLHLTQDQLLKLYKKVSESAKATGTDITTAAEQAGRAIMIGQVRPVGVLGKQLYQALHAHGKLTKQMTGASRLKLVEGALGDNEGIAKAMSKGMGDNIRRIQMDVEKLFRRLSGPVFKSVADQIGKWAEYIERAEKDSKPLIDIWADKLKGAFEYAKEITGFLVDHWKELAAIWASFKIGSMAGGVAGGLEGIAKAIGGNIGGAMGLFGKGLGGMAGAIGPVVLGLGALKLGLDALLDWIGTKMDKKREIEEHAGSMMGSAGILSRMPVGSSFSPWEERIGAKAVKDLVKSGALDQYGRLDKGGMTTNFAHMGDSDKEKMADALGIRVKGLPVSQMAATQFADALAAKLEPILSAHPELLPGFKKAEAATEVDTKNLKTKGTQIGPFTGPITINQKFDDVDPDRIWIATRQGFQEGAERATQSSYSTHFGE